jgi:uncharacterized protein (DUF1330 family)
MNAKLKIALATAIGAVLGAAATQVLHAQAKPKAYRIVEAEVLDPAAVATYNSLVKAAIKAAGGRNFNTAGGRIVAFAGAPPKRVAITEWESLEQAQAFVNSAIYKNLSPQLDKAAKLIRECAVEVASN